MTEQRKERVEALVTPEVLKWARQSLGLTVEEIAGRLGTSVERVKQWEAGERRPTIRQARLWADATKRPLVVFYLPEPPKDFKPLRDFRQLPGGADDALSPDLRYQIRTAYEQRELVLELLEEAEEQATPLALSISSDDDPEEAGAKMREFLGVTLEQQKGWTGKYEPLNSWRAAMEARGVLVFQSARVDVEEMRGFSIAEKTLPVIVLNPKDWPRARVFTLLHEFAHIASRRDGLCDLRGGAAVEVFCNAVAGEALVPRKALEDQIIGMKNDTDWTDKVLRWLAGMFSVSEEVILRRLVTLKRASGEFYQKKRGEYLSRYRQAAERRKQGQAKGGPPPHRRAIAQLGSPLLALAIQSYGDGRISLNDLATISGVGVQYLADIRAEVMG